MLQNATSREISAQTSEYLWWACLLYCACHAKCIFPDPLQMSHACYRFWTCYKSPHVLLTFWQCTQSLAPAAPDDIWTSKSGPRPSVFNTFDFETCFAPQRRALFRHLNFQKCFGASVLCTFWLRHVHRATTACTFSTSQLCSHPGAPCAFWLPNVLRATTVCTFSTSQLPKVLRSFCALYILTSTCASRHNGVHFFDISTVLPPWCALRILTSKCASCHNGVHFFDISTSKSALNLVCFAHFDFEMCFAPQRRVFFLSHLPHGSAPAALASLLLDPPEPQIIGKTMFCDFGTFSRTCIFCLLTLSLLWSSLFFSSLTLPTSAFPSVLSEVWRLNFLRLILVTIITHCESHLTTLNHYQPLVTIQIQMAFFLVHVVRDCQVQEASRWVHRVGRLSRCHFYGYNQWIANGW